MKNILFVVESLAGGGAEKVLLTLVKNLDKKIQYYGFHSNRNRSIC